MNPFSESPGSPYTRRTPDAFRAWTITSATVVAIACTFPPFAYRRFVIGSRLERLVAPVEGLPFGATVWATGYVVLPEAGIYKPIWR